MKNISFRDYIAQMTDAIQYKPFQKFVLDLRFNTGGDNTIAANALHDLAKHLKNKKVYIIIDGTTFSAGVTAAALFKSLTGAKIIGSPAGDSLIYLSEGGNVVLPHSNLSAHYANGLHNDKYKKDFTIAPDKKIQISFADYLQGEDTILNYIINESNA